MCFARVDPENGGCGCVDDTEANPAAAFDLNDIGIGQGSVIGEIGIPVVVVEIHRHVTHIHGHRAHSPGLALVHSRHAAMVHALHRA